MSSGSFASTVSLAMASILRSLAAMSLYGAALAACGGPELPMTSPPPHTAPMARPGPLSFRPPLGLQPAEADAGFGRFVAAGDFDGDGFPDLAAHAYDSRMLTLFYGQAGADLSAPRSLYAPAQNVDPIRVGDLDGDGLPDIALLAPAGINDQGSINVLFGGKNMRPRAEQNLLPASSVQSFTLADLDDDARSDVVAGSGNDGITVLLNRGMVNGLPQIASSTYLLGGPVASVTVADLDHDGVKDVLALSSTSAAPTRVWILRGDSGGRLAMPTTLTLAGKIEAVAVADLDGDGTPEILAADRTTGQVAALRRVDGGMYKEVGNYLVGNGSYGPLRIADMDNDGKLDIVVLSAGDIHILLGGDGTYQFHPPVKLRFNQQIAITYDLAIADFNQDGRLDLAAPIAGTDIQFAVFFSQ